MKSFEEFRQEQQQQLDEIPLLGLGTAAKFLGAKALGDLIWKGGKKVVGAGANAAKHVAGKAVGEVGKTVKKAWDGGDREISGVKGKDEKGLPSSN